MQVMQVMQVIQDKNYTEKVTILNCAIWWPNLELMQVAPSGGHFCNKGRWRHLMANFATNASGVILWPKLEPMRIALQFGTYASGVIWWSNFVLIQVEDMQLAFGTNASDILFNWRDNSS